MSHRATLRVKLRTGNSLLLSILNPCDGFIMTFKSSHSEICSNCWSDDYRNPGDNDEFLYIFTDEDATFLLLIHTVDIVASR